MTSMTPMTRTATFRARDGRGGQLVMGLEVLAFGSHSPGDGELVADWWTT
jgi:hypothetical protein